MNSVLIWPNGELLGFDLETTGVDPEVAHPVSFAFVTVGAREIINRRSALVHPGLAIPSESTAIHGINDAMVREHGLSLSHALEVIVDVLLDASNRGVPLIGMNVAYDLSLIDALLVAKDGLGLRALGWGGPVLDIAVIDRQMDKWRRGKRRLGDLCEHYGVELLRAHDAEADTAASIFVLIALTEAFPELVDLTPLALTEQQVVWRKDWMADYNRYLIESGRPSVDDRGGIWPLLSDRRSLESSR